MKRTLMVLSAALGVAGMLFSSGAASAQPGAGAPPAGAPPAAAPATRPTIAVFNMAAVMRDFGQAKYQVFLLNNKKNEMSKQLVLWRSEYIQLQQERQKAPQAPDAEAKAQRMLALARSIEDEDRKVSKQLNDDASSIIADLYDKMKAVVDKTAELNGYHIVFAYPDAVTDEEKRSPYIKELKLKPPAAQPFYVAPHADVTAVVVKTLNAWYPPVDPVTKQVIPLEKLEEMIKAATQPPAPAGTNPGAGGTPMGGIPSGLPGKP